MKRIIATLRLLVLVGFVGLWVGSAWAQDDCTGLNEVECRVWLEIEKPSIERYAQSMTDDERQSVRTRTMCWDLSDQTQTSQAAAMEFLIQRTEWETMSFDAIAEQCEANRPGWKSDAHVDTTYIDRMDNLMMVFNEMRENMQEHKALTAQYNSSADFATRSDLAERLKQLNQEITDTLQWFREEQGIRNYYTGDNSALYVHEEK